MRVKEESEKTRDLTKFKSFRRVYLPNRGHTHRDRSRNSERNSSSPPSLGGGM